MNGNPPEGGPPRDLGPSIAEALPFAAQLWDDAGRLMMANQRHREFWPPIEPARTLEAALADLLADPDAAGRFAAALRSGDPIDEWVAFRAHPPARLMLLPLGGARPDSPRAGWLLLFDDAVSPPKDEFPALRGQLDALERARSVAQQESRTKSAFLAMISHEVRSPLTSMLGQADRLLDEGLDPAAAREAALALRRGTEHLMDVVNDLLDLSQIEAGRLGIRREPCAWEGLLDEVFALLAPTAEVRGLHLVREVVGTMPHSIEFDRLRVRQILINLIGNAIKYTATGEIRLRFGPWEPAEGPAGTLRFEVSDTGRGIPAELVDDLFHPYRRATDAATRAVGGAGLGLSLCKAFAQAHGGDIELINAPGLGARFVVTVRTGPAADPIPKPEDLAPIDPPPPELVGRLLLAEDNLDNQRLIGHLLRRAGAFVEAVADGQAAIDRALAAEESGTPFDLVVMDMLMPVVDGLTAARRLRALGYRRPILALTANAMVGDREVCIAAGCNDYQSKPIRREQLIRRVATLLEEARASH